MAISEMISDPVEPVQSHNEATGVSLDPATLRVLSSMPEGVRNSFTSEQLEALSAANLAQSTNHWIDYRASLPWFGRRFYVRLFLGKERRNFSRLVSEGQISLPKTSIGFVFGLWMICCLALFGSVIVLYLIKSTIGVNLFDGPSVFHPIFFN